MGVNYRGVCARNKLANTKAAAGLDRGWREKHNFTLRLLPAPARPDGAHPAITYVWGARPALGGASLQSFRDRSLASPALRCTSAAAGERDSLPLDT